MRVTDMIPRGPPAAPASRDPAVAIPSTFAQAFLAAASAPGRAASPALIEGPLRWTYDQLVERASRVASALTAAGLDAGQRALLLFRGGAAFIEAYLGCALAGVVPVPCHPGHGRETAGAYAGRSGAAAILAGDGPEERAVAGALVASSRLVLCFDAPGAGAPGVVHASRLPAFRGGAISAPAVDPSSPMVLLMTSGTTGPRQLVARSHAAFLRASLRFGELWGCRPGVVFAAGSLITHAAALGWGVHPVLIGGGTLVTPRDRRPGPLLDEIIASGAEVVFLVPSQGRAMLAELLARGPAARAGGLRQVIFGGEPLPSELAVTLERRLGVTVQNTYGMTEGFCAATDRHGLEDIAAGCVGQPCDAGDALSVRDGEGAPLSDGEPGELWVRSAAWTEGAWDGGIRPLPADRTGFFPTGDVVRLAGRRIFYLGRRKTLINRGGLKILPEELELHLGAHPDVLATAVVPLPDALLGERVCALVVCRPGATLGAAALGDHLASRGAGRLLRIDETLQVNELPLGAVGKLDRAACAALARAHHAGASAPRN